MSFVNNYFLRFLIKNWELVTKNINVKLPASVEYFRVALNQSLPPVTWDSSLKGIVTCLKAVAAKYLYQESTQNHLFNNFVFVIFRKISIAYEHLQQRLRSGLIREVATNQTSIELAQAADAHCRALFVEIAVERTRDISLNYSGALSTVIGQLIELFAVETCQRSIGDLVRVKAHIFQTIYR